MSEPTYSITIRYDALTPVEEIEKVCDQHDIVLYKNPKFLVFHADDPKKFFLLGLNYPTSRFKNDQ